MTRIELAPEVLDDLDRFVDHMTNGGAEDVDQRTEELLGALQLHAHSPLLRPYKGHPFVMRSLTGGEELAFSFADRGPWLAAFPRSAAV